MDVNLCGSLFWTCSFWGKGDTWQDASGFVGAGDASISELLNSFCEEVGLGVWCAASDAAAAAVAVLSPPCVGCFFLLR
jgi:hypothetical protein